MHSGSTWSTGFRRMRCRACAHLPIRAADLREPWEQVVTNGVAIQRWHGALLSATACAQLDRHDLARRLLSWLRSDLTIEFRYFGDSARVGFDVVGLDWERDSAGPCTDTIDELIAEVLTIADDLDQQSP